MKLHELYDKSVVSFNKFYFAAAVIGLGIFLMVYLSAPKADPAILAANSVKLPCPGTKPVNQEVLDKTDLKTIYQVAVIDVDREITFSSRKKNEIAPISRPKFKTWQDFSECYDPSDEFLVVNYHGITRVYSQKILEHHIVVNDQIYDSSLLVSYSPLADAYSVYVREYQDEVIAFGASGHLYKNDDLLFDSKTESLWSQLEGKAVVGSMTGASLTKYPFSIVNFAEARKLFPSAQVLDFDTGFAVNYAQRNFVDFANDNSIMGKTTNFSDTFPVKKIVYGFNYQNKNYLLSELGKEVQLNGKSVVIDKANFKVKIEGKEVQLYKAYWYVWYDFFPDTKVLS